MRHVQLPTVNTPIQQVKVKASGAAHLLQLASKWLSCCLGAVKRDAQAEKARGRRGGEEEDDLKRS